jgi:hypothetical protein
MLVSPVCGLTEYIRGTPQPAKRETGDVPFRTVTVNVPLWYNYAA